MHSKNWKKGIQKIPNICFAIHFLFLIRYLYICDVENACAHHIATHNDNQTHLIRFLVKFDS